MGTHQHLWIANTCNLCGISRDRANGLLLRGGRTTGDVRLDRLPEFDEKSLEFPIRAALTTAQERKKRSYTWRLDLRLDQGREGACVGFGWTHELGARPSVVLGLTEREARKFYLAAQFVDEWAGESYEGTSVLAGAKVLQSHGWMTEYRWAFGLDDLILAVGYKGPAVLGLNWYEGMYEPDTNGYLRPTGEKVGGHAFVVNGVSVRNRRFLMTNSWGSDWGLGGQAYISFEDMESLLHDEGEACLPVGRKMTGTRP